MLDRGGRDKKTTRPEKRRFKPAQRPNNVVTDRKGNILKRDDKGKWQERKQGKWKPAPPDKRPETRPDRTPRDKRPETRQERTPRDKGPETRQETDPA